jgi:hypothetical protein
MSKLLVTSTYQAICACGNTYGDASDNEIEAEGFISEFPTCDECEASA